ncbi:MAG: DUF504 domain-containing protein [Rhodocyclaceae bacterium]
MQPIHELLSRIRWDANFGRGEFVLGYWDRVDRRLHRVRLSDTARDPDNPELLLLTDEDGTCHDVPLHRIRAVWRNGELIWQRHGKEVADAQKE